MNAHVRAPFWSRWDSMSAATTSVIMPWSAKWDDAIADLRSKQIGRLLAWGDESSRCDCRYEYEGNGTVCLNPRVSHQRAGTFLALIREIVTSIETSHSQTFRFEPDYVSRGVGRFDFKCSIDLRDGVDVRIVLHLSKSCGTVFILTLSPEMST